MKKLLVILCLTAVSGAASAGIIDKVKKVLKNGALTYEKVQMNNNLFVPAGTYFSPNGIDLFNACDAGDEYRTINKVAGSCLAYTYSLKDSDAVYDAIPYGGNLHTQAGIAEFVEKYPIISNRFVHKSCTERSEDVYAYAPKTRSQCVTELVVYNDNDGDGDEYRSACMIDDDGNPVMETSDFPETQKIMAWYKIDPFSGHPNLIDDGDTPQGSFHYTIPACEGEVTPVPNKTDDDVTPVPGKKN